MFIETHTRVGTHKHSSDGTLPMGKNLNENSLLLLISTFLLNIPPGKITIVKDLK